MPIVLEKEKNIETLNGKQSESRYAVQSVNIISDSIVVLGTINEKTALGLNKKLQFFINMSGTEGGEEKLNFQTKILQTPDSKESSLIQVQGDIGQAVKFMARSYFSDDTAKRVLELLKPLSTKIATSFPTPTVRDTTKFFSEPGTPNKNPGAFSQTPSTSTSENNSNTSTPPNEEADKQGMRKISSSGRISE